MALKYSSPVVAAVVLMLMVASPPMIATATTPKPVIMMHGVGSNHGEMATLQRLMESEHPGTVATSLPLFEDKQSFLNPLDKQVTGVVAAIRNLVKANERYQS